MLSPITIQRLRRRSGRGTGSLWGLLGIVGLPLLGIIGVALATAGVAAYTHLARDLPPAEQFGELTLTAFETTKIYDRSGEHLLFEVVHDRLGDRTIVPFSDIPLHMRNATIALEDRTFYSNPGGINLAGIARAAISNLLGERIQGGSSITAQLVRNVAMDPEERFAVSYERKLRETILSVELTRRYPGPEGRDRILAWYLNTVPYGNRAYGVEAAAKVYFGKHARDLTLAEAAMLAAIPNRPALNPIHNPDLAKARQAIVLQAMVSEGYITPAEAEAAKQAELGRPRPAEELDIRAPHFVMYVLDVLEERYGRRAVYGGGLRVITSLDMDLQREAERIVRERVTAWDAVHRARNASAVVIRPDTGEVLAMVGAVDFTDKSIDGQVNMATSPRQPGSSFKLFTYAAAFEQGYAPATVLYDVRTSFPIAGRPPYVPENFDRKYRGPLSLRFALGCSYNIPAVALQHSIGTDSVLGMAHRLGITTLRERGKYGLALTLGSGEVSLLDQTFAYGVLANGGMMAGTPVHPNRREPGLRELDPVSILRVTDGRGQVLDEFRGPTVQEVLSPQVSFLVTHILADNAARTPAYGANSALRLQRPAAAKTGTTNNYVDAWCVGYTPQLAVGVWMGNSDREPMVAMWGGRGAAPIWRDIMEYALRDEPKVDFVEPPGLKWVTVDADSGLLPGPFTIRTVREVFIADNEPTTADNARQQFAICRASGRLATPYCPAGEIGHQVFTIHPPIADDWVRSTNQPQPPTTYCDKHGPNLRAAEASIISPGIYQAVRGTVPILGNARIPGFREFQVEYGQGLQPAQWMPIGDIQRHTVENYILQHWNTEQLSGLYTLRLTVRGNYDRQLTIPVTVDQVAPRIAIIHPTTGTHYVRRFDDHVNFQVTAFDNMAMDRVEFFVNGQKVGESRVAPFTVPWGLVLRNANQSIIPAVPSMEVGELVLEESGQRVTWRKEVVGDITTHTRQTGEGDALSRTVIMVSQQETSIVMPDGWGAIWGTNSYTETNQLHAVAYDAAGNATSSAPVRIYVTQR